MDNSELYTVSITIDQKLQVYQRIGSLTPGLSDKHGAAITVTAVAYLVGLVYGLSISGTGNTPTLRQRFSVPALKKADVCQAKTGFCK
jgi:hypothetical protein